ncbi:MAG: type III-A CRISPR-associated RAMP protein Csm5 [Thermoprotei archaeon]|nr:MAG: type III-A CRISPR-associated RAMP protein Csm5 [Thermoprotei archaeon]
MVVKRYHIDVRVETAVHVWSGENYVKDLDLIVRNGKAYILDYNLLVEKLVAKNIDIAKITDEMLRSPQTLLDKYDIRLEDISSYILNVPKELNVSRDIKKQITIGNAKAIPGSEIKGLFRTAYLHYYLKYKARQDLVKAIRDSIEMIMENCKVNVKKAGYSIEAVLKGYISTGRKGGERPYDVFQCIQVTDPIDLNTKCYLENIVVYDRASGNVVANQTIEALAKNSRLRYILGIYEKPGTKLIQTTVYNIRDLDSKIDEVHKSLFDALKYFSKDVIQYEIKLLSESKFGEYDVSKQINLMKKWLGEVDKGEAYYLKIGFATGHYAKTIYLALPDDLKRYLINIMSYCVKLVSHGRISEWDHKTLKLLGSLYVNKKVVPFGWIKLRVERVGD